MLKVTVLQINPVNVLCPFCPHSVENEMHVVFNCPVYADLRDKYLTVKRHVPLQLQLVNLFQCATDDIQHRLSKFLFFVIKKRRERAS